MFTIIPKSRSGSSRNAVRIISEPRSPWTGFLLRRSEFADATFGPATRLIIRVKQPETELTVCVGKLQSWLDGGGKSPNEQVLKSRLREML